MKGSSLVSEEAVNDLASSVCPISVLLVNSSYLYLSIQLTNLDKFFTHKIEIRDRAVGQKTEYVVFLYSLMVTTKCASMIFTGSL